MWTNKVVGSGCKWTFKQLKEYFVRAGYDFDNLWFKIKTIVMLTLINFSASVQDWEWGFELLGFDIMVDNKFKPWLIEVNTPPALDVETPVDEMIKPKLVKDILEILDFEKYDDYHK